MLDKEQLIYKITNLPYYLKLVVADSQRIKSGLRRKERDKRNFKTSFLGWSIFGYTPKNQRKVIDPLVYIDQGIFNCCVFCGTISQKMDEEMVELDISDAVSYAKKQGWISGNGFADVDTGLKVLQKYGCRKGKNNSPLSSESWSDFSSRALNFGEAGKYKIKSYWEVDSKDDILKILDDGKTLNTGIDWYSGFNQGGGFKSPWLITKALGYKVGGHDIKLCGYDLDYQGRKVFAFTNSYSKDWGDSGKFYIDMDYFWRNNYGVFAALDEEVDYGSFLTQYDGKDVKAAGSPAVYHIQKGQKKVYLHEMDYFAWNPDKEKMEVYVVDTDMLNKVPTGDSMDITKAPTWDVLKHLDQPLNITRVVEAIKANK